MPGSGLADAARRLLAAQPLNILERSELHRLRQCKLQVPAAFASEREELDALHAELRRELEEVRALTQDHPLSYTAEPVAELYWRRPMAEAARAENARKAREAEQAAEAAREEKARLKRQREEERRTYARQLARECHVTLSPAERAWQESLRSNWAEHDHAEEAPEEPIYSAAGDCGRPHLSLSAACACANVRNEQRERASAPRPATSTSSAPRPTTAAESARPAPRPTTAAESARPAPRPTTAAESARPAPRPTTAAGPARPAPSTSSAPPTTAAGPAPGLPAIRATPASSGPAPGLPAIRATPASSGPAPAVSRVTQPVPQRGHGPAPTQPAPRPPQPPPPTALARAPTRPAPTGTAGTRLAAPLRLVPPTRDPVPTPTPGTGSRPVPAAREPVPGPRVGTTSKPPGTTPRQAAILDAVRASSGPMSANAIASAVGGRKATVLEDVRALVRDGVLVQGDGGLLLAKVSHRA